MDAVEVYMISDGYRYEYRVHAILLAAPGKDLKALFMGFVKDTELYRAEHYYYSWDDMVYGRGFVTGGREEWIKRWRGKYGLPEESYIDIPQIFAAWLINNHGFIDPPQSEINVEDEQRGIKIEGLEEEDY